MREFLPDTLDLFVEDRQNGWLWYHTAKCRKDHAQGNVHIIGWEFGQSTESVRRLQGSFRDDSKIGACKN